MPKYVIERTSGSGEQFVTEATSEAEALSSYLVHRSNVERLLREYDEETDPDGSYLADGPGGVTWKHLTISIGRVQCEDCGEVLPDEHSLVFDICDSCVAERDGDEIAQAARG